MDKLEERIVILPTRTAPLQTATWKDQFKLIIIRFARWAGWLYFVDQNLLDAYLNAARRTASK
jgi:hypothetical protein